MKAIFADEIRPGATVMLYRDGPTGIVERVLVGGPNSVVVTIICSDGEFSRHTLSVGMIVGLMHQPYSVGMDECEILLRIDKAIMDYRFGLVSPEAGRKAMQQALETYELGKPEHERT